MQRLSQVDISLGLFLLPCRAFLQLHHGRDKSGGRCCLFVIGSTRLSSTHELRGPFSRGAAGLGHFSSFRGLILSSNFVPLYTVDSYDLAYLTSDSCLG
jgi:hypothetical protein